MYFVEVLHKEPINQSIMSMTLTLNGTTQKAVRAGVQNYISDAVKFLSEKYGFDANEATDEIAFKVNFVKNKELNGVEGMRDGDDDTMKPNIKLHSLDRRGEHRLVRGHRCQSPALHAVHQDALRWKQPVWFLC